MPRSVILRRGAHALALSSLLSSQLSSCVGGDGDEGGAPAGATAGATAAPSNAHTPSARPSSAELRPVVRDYPLERDALSLTRLLDGQRVSAIQGLRRALRAPLVDGRSPELLAHPDRWIQARLSGPAADLARLIWEQSGRLLSPLRCAGALALLEARGWVEVSPDQRWRVSARGHAWGLEVEGSALPSPSSERLKVDGAEGLLELLSALIAGGGDSAEGLSAAWGASLRRRGVRRASEWLLDATMSRLTHLQERALVERAGRRWSVTELGLSWLRRAGRGAPTRDEGELEQLWALLHAQRQRARESMRALLLQMDPLAFEALICDLLERLGYRDVTLTARTHDLGIDIVATIELGITSVREVIQVKRHQRNIQRPVLDALRGSLHRAHAVRGTLITTSDFSKGTQEAAFESGAAPITLIHGERLIDLLMEHELGARKTQVTLWRVDPSVFEARPSSLRRQRVPLSDP